ncbi:hypothetical protein ACOZE3_02905 [Streptomyces cinereoruber]|uniref:hypothetical protein n=1 Tax=Streptomyces cinereoruber TaxID=67260 RepID=UPI003BF4C4BC
MGPPPPYRAVVRGRRCDHPLRGGEALATLSLVGRGDERSTYGLPLAAVFAGGVGNMPAVVGLMVTAASGLPDAEQGMATGIATMPQQVGIALGTPVMSAVAVTAATLPGGIARAVLVDAAAVLVTALTPALLLRRSRR